MRTNLQRKTVIKGCCDSFTQQINRHCEEHGWDCADNIIRFYTDFEGNPIFGLQHPLEPSYYHIHYCPYCGSALEPIAASAVDGFVKYSLVYNDGFGGVFVGIVNNADIRWGTSGLPYFPKYIDESKYSELFNVGWNDFEGKDETAIQQMLREKCPNIEFDTKIIV